MIYTLSINTIELSLATNIKDLEVGNYVYGFLVFVYLITQLQGYAYGCLANA